MISCKFTENGFTISGHSGYADEGGDIVCSAVSSMTMLVCNIITERLHKSAEVKSDAKSATVIFRLNEIPDSVVGAIISGFKAELVGLSESYPDNIEVI